MAKSDKCALDDQQSLIRRLALHAAIRVADSKIYSSVMAFKAFSLPDRDIDSVDAIAYACYNAREDHLHTVRGGSLKNGAKDHDPAAPHYAALATEAVCRQECDDSANETADIVDGSDHSFGIGTRIVKVPTKRIQTNHSA